ncbi:MAG: AraC family transcriptional regulator ligand-binding domain-containing protein [Burkholderiaceae bacterium]|nr:AraC family transcriptional regulator ligand-binding domain-containing protein [Burkholderiaceae bacterium]
MAEHTVAIFHVEQALQGALRRGVAAGPLLERAGISPALLDAPLARVSQAQYGALLRLLRRTLRDEFFGLLERPLPLGCFAHCLRLLVRAPTLGEAMRDGLRYFHGLIDAFAPRLRVDGEMASLSIVPHDPFDRASGYAQRSFLFFAFGLASWLAARRIPLTGVEYRDPGSPRGADTDRVFQTRVLYGRPQYRLWFESRWLALPQVQNEASLREFLRAAPTNLLVRYRDRTRATDRLRRLLHSRLHDELPSLQQVARDLAMTPQTLSRRLREEGHSFQALKDDVRRDAAIALLQRPDLTLLDVASGVGFSEASTFHRAFKKWTGVAPGEYRQRAR